MILSWEFLYEFIESGLSIMSRWSICQKAKLSPMKKIMDGFESRIIVKIRCKDYF